MIYILYETYRYPYHNLDINVKINPDNNPNRKLNSNHNNNLREGSEN